MVKQSVTIFLLIILFLFACTAKKKIPQAVKCRIENKSAKTLSALLKQNQAQYSTFSGKIKTNVIVDEKGTEFSVALKMRKDSIIWASVSQFGIEGIRFVATKDSIKFIDRINSKYFIGNYDTLSKMLNADVDLEILQSLLIGNSVQFYEEDEKLRAGIDSCKYILGTIRKRRLRRMIVKGKELKEPAQNIWMLDSTFKISRLLFREFESKREFDAHFSNFQNAEIPEDQVKKVLIPFDIIYNVKSNKIITIHLEYTKASVNKPQKFVFTIPEGYERIGK